MATQDELLKQSQSYTSKLKPGAGNPALEAAMSSAQQAAANPTLSTGTAPATSLAPSAAPSAVPSAAPSATDPTKPELFKAPEIASAETVSGQLKELFAEGSPLLDRARKQGEMAAADRGLQNSSLAAQAGAEALFQTALPIAQQDAATYAQRARQSQLHGEQSYQQAQQHVQKLAELAKQGDINSRLQLEQFGYNFALSEQENIHNMSLAALQGDIQKELALQQFGFDVDLMKQDFGYRLDLADVELRNALEMAQMDDELLRGRMQLEHQNTLDQIGKQGDIQGGLQDQQFTQAMQQNYLVAVERRTLQFSSEVTAIYQTQGLTPQQQQNAVAVARRNMENDIAMLQSYYSSNPDWDPEWKMTSPATSGGTPFVGPGGTPGYQPPPPSTGPGGRRLYR